MSTSAIKTVEQQLEYPKRSGTSGISGQHYETKLLTLAFLRAQTDKKITNFLLGTNLDGIGNFDDLILSYDLEGKRRILFVQAKHRDDPRKNKLTWNDIFTETGDFSLFKYFDSYLQIISKFNATKNSNEIFKIEPENVKLDLIVYTSAEVNFSQSEEKFIAEIQQMNDENDFLKTCDDGKIFQIKCENIDEIDNLMKAVSVHHLKQLATSLAEFIFSKKNNYSNMMLDDMIRIYHVVLANRVINVVESSVQEKSSVNFWEGKFSPEFYESDDDLMKVLREALSEHAISNRDTEKIELNNTKELLAKIISGPCSADISQLLGSVLVFNAKNCKLTIRNNIEASDIISFKNEIENLEISKYLISEAVEIAGKEKLKSISFNLPVNFGNRDFRVKEKRLTHLVKKFIELIRTSENSDNGIRIVKIDCNTKSLQGGELGMNGGIAGLVGNALVLDEETGFLKFNYRVNGENARKFLQMLESQLQEIDQVDLNNVRFDINVVNFPVLTLHSPEGIIRDFLTKLKFYVNQSKENEVEIITKDEMMVFHEFDRNLPYRIAIDAIYLNFHDAIQKWWKDPKGSYLTKDSKLLKDAFSCSIVECQLLTVLNFLYFDRIPKDINFNEKSVNRLQLDNFINDSSKQCLNIFTNECELTAIKVRQYFKSETSQIDYYVIDLDYIYVKSCCFDVVKELVKKDILLIVDCSRKDKISEFLDELRRCVFKKFLKRKVILLSATRLVDMKLADSVKNCLEIDDERNGVIDLDTESQARVLIESKVILQGKELPFRAVIDDDILGLISDTVLLRLLKNGSVKIGQMVSNLDKNVEPHYIPRFFRTEKNTSEETLNYEPYDSQSESSEEDSERFHTIPTFPSPFDWHIPENKFADYIIDNSLNKAIIITAPPGMGKSTTLTHMAFLVKEKDSHSWLLRINLNNCTRFLKDLVFSDHEDEFEEFEKATDFLSHSLNFETNFEKKLFIRNIRQCGKVKIILFFDGFDEISPNYKEQTLRLLQILNKTDLVNILVTTRPYNFVSELETKLNASLFEFEGLRSDDLIEYLLTFWKESLKINNFDKIRAMMFINILIERLNTLFLSNPLHLKMVAEYFTDDLEKFSSSQYSSDLTFFKENIGEINLSSLYGELIRKKYEEIFLDEKKKVDRSNLHVQSGEEVLYGIFVREHQVLALNCLLNEETLNCLFANEINQEQMSKLSAEFNIGKKKEGIICTVIEGKARFIHRTYAEFFVSNYIMEKFKSPTIEEFRRILKSGILMEVFMTKFDQLHEFFEGEIEMSRRSGTFVNEKERVGFFLNYFDYFALIHSTALDIFKIFKLFVTDRDPEYTQEIVGECTNQTKVGLFTTCFLILPTKLRDVLLEEIDIKTFSEVLINKRIPSDIGFVDPVKEIEYLPFAKKINENMKLFELNGVFTVMEFIQTLHPPFRLLDFYIEISLDIIKSLLQIRGSFISFIQYLEYTLRNGSYFEFEPNIASSEARTGLKKLIKSFFKEFDKFSEALSYTYYELIDDGSTFNEIIDEIETVVMKFISSLESLNQGHEILKKCVDRLLLSRFLFNEFSQQPGKFSILGKTIIIKEKLSKLLNEYLPSCNCIEKEFSLHGVAVDPLKRDFSKCRDLFNHLESGDCEKFIQSFEDLNFDLKKIVINVRDKSGKALIDIAFELENHKIFDLLRENGAKRSFEFLNEFNRFGYWSIYGLWKKNNLSSIQHQII